MIHLIITKATREEMTDMLKILQSYIKVAVDIQKSLVGGGELHADCEAVLLDHGSNQENIWGANWILSTKKLAMKQC